MQSFPESMLPESDSVSIMRRISSLKEREAHVLLVSPSSSAPRENRDWAEKVAVVRTDIPGGHYTPLLLCCCMFSSSTLRSGEKSLSECRGTSLSQNLFLSLQGLVVRLYDRSCWHSVQIKILSVIPTPEEAAQYALIGNAVRQYRVTPGRLLLRVWRRSTI